VEAGTIPVVGGNALQRLQCLTRPCSDGGSPANNPQHGWQVCQHDANMTVLVTSGSGGTGYLAIQMMRALGAANIIMAARGVAID